MENRPIEPGVLDQRKHDKGVWVDVPEMEKEVAKSGGTSDELLHNVLIHEFLHAAGLDHLPDGQRGIMASDPKAADRLSDADLAECHRMEMCD